MSIRWIAPRQGRSGRRARIAGRPRRHRSCLRRLARRRTAQGRRSGHRTQAEAASGDAADHPEQAITLEAHPRGDRGRFPASTIRGDPGAARRNHRAGSDAPLSIERAAHSMVTGYIPLGDQCHPERTNRAARGRGAVTRSAGSRRRRTRCRTGRGTRCRARMFQVDLLHPHRLVAAAIPRRGLATIFSWRSIRTRLPARRKRPAERRANTRHYPAA